MNSITVKFLLILLSASPLCSGSRLDTQSLELVNPNRFNDLADSSWAYDGKTGDPETNESFITSKAPITNICDLYDDLMDNIGSYLIDPVASLGLLNKRFFALFHEKYSLKHYVMQRFDMPELNTVSESEFELHGILSLTWCHNDLFLLFGALMESLSSKKKPFKVLLHPLLSYLNRLCNGLDQKQGGDIGKFLNRFFNVSFENYLGQICANHGDFASAFEYLKNSPNHLIRFVSRIENIIPVFFKPNPDFAAQYEDALRRIEIHENNVFRSFFETKKWIAECIVYDTPEEFYTGLLTYNPLLLLHLIQSDQFLTLDFPESDYPRIHSQMRRFFNDYLSPLIGQPNEISAFEFDFYNYIIDLRFGPENVPLRLDFDDKSLFIKVAKAALLGNKKEIFFKACNAYNPTKPFDGLNRYNPFRKYDPFRRFIPDNDGPFTNMDEIINVNYLSRNCSPSKNLKTVFDIIAENSESFAFEEHLLRFIISFYAIQHVKFESYYVYFEFVALDDLLTLGYPPKICGKAINWSSTSYEFLDNVFYYMKVINEETVSSFLSDYKKFPLFKRKHRISLELIELLTRSSDLLQKFIDARVKFILNPTAADFPKYLDLFALENSTQIIGSFIIPSGVLAELQMTDLVGLERILPGKIVGQFLAYEKESTNMQTRFSECEYFRWRNVFAWWIKSAHKERISEIKSPDIIEMLKLEFPDEMRKIFRY